MDTGQALQLARIEDNKLIFDHTLFSKILDRIGHRKFCVISLNGRTRCGKSFMGSQFLKYLDCKSKGNLADWVLEKNTGSFPWDTNADRMTKGIQVWSEPVFISQGIEEIALLLLDTQGLFDHETSHKQNAQLFTLSSLLSSNFIFNDGVSSEDVFEFLYVFLQYSKVTDEAGGKLLFLRRDWENDDEYALGYHSSTTEPPGSAGNLQKCLFDVQPDQTEESMATRRGISELTKDIAVYALPTPVIIPDPNVPTENWDTKFKAEVVKFVEWIFSDTQLCSNLKQIRGQPITGHEMKTFVAEWAHILHNSDCLPNLQSLETATTNLVGAKLIRTSLDLFSSQMNSILNGFANGCPSAEFEHLSAQQINQILVQFDETNSMGAGKDKFRHELISEITSLRRTLKQCNDAKLQLAAEFSAVAQRAEEERNRRFQAEADARAAAEASEVAHQQLAAADGEKLRQKQASIAVAEAEVSRANEAVTAALGNLSNVQANTAAFNQTVTITTKHRNRGPFGIVLSPSYTYHNEIMLNTEGYNQAVNIAQQAVNIAKAALANANANLATARNS